MKIAKGYTRHGSCKNIILNSIEGFEGLISNLSYHLSWIIAGLVLPGMLLSGVFDDEYLHSDTDLDALSTVSVSLGFVAFITVGSLFLSYQLFKYIFPRG